jgi:rRNA maturation endonuclease Nob1
MAEQMSELDIYCRTGSQAGLKVLPTQAPAKNLSLATLPFAARQRETLVSGIQVREEALRTIQAQRMYKLRCECGRSWFELEWQKFVQCPACHKPGLVSE